MVDEAAADDPFVICPFPDRDSYSERDDAAIDLRLGTWFVLPRQARMPVLKVSLESGAGPPEPKLPKLQYVPFGEDFYLHPGSFVLGVTLEWIRLPRDLAGYVIGKSSWGRRGLVIATAAGVHPRFSGCLTLELSNLGEIPIELKPGLPVCQLFLHSVDQFAPTDMAVSGTFIGSRRPRIGAIAMDSVTKRLARS